jgi:hypothetical protein
MNVRTRPTGVAIRGMTWRTSRVAAVQGLNAHSLLRRSVLWQAGRTGRVAAVEVVVKVRSSWRREARKPEPQVFHEARFRLVDRDGDGGVAARDCERAGERAASRGGGGAREEGG